jgi:hypothetical protein
MNVPGSYVAKVVHGLGESARYHEGDVVALYLRTQEDIQKVRGPPCVGTEVPDKTVQEEDRG